MSNFFCMVIVFFIFFNVFSTAAAETESISNAPEMQSVKFPSRWDKYGDAENATAEDGIIKVISQGNGGISGFIKTIPQLRFNYSFEAKGEGQLSAGLYGTYGWIYTPTLELKKDQWTGFKFTQADMNDMLQLVIFSRVATPSTFEIRNLKAEPAAMPEMDSDDMPPKLFPAYEYRGGNGRAKEGVAGAMNGKAVWGKCWYFLCNLPVPANSRELFYYVHIEKNIDKDFALFLRNAAEDFIASNKYSTPANTKWNWVKIGPVKASFAMPTAILLGDGDENVEVLVDKIIVTTNAQLSDKELDEVK